MAERATEAAFHGSATEGTANWREGDKTKEEGTAADAEQTATCGCPQSGCGRGCGRLRLPAKQLSAAVTVGEVAVGD
ncbi:hypothetical protein E5332_01495 [Enterorhabdus sp. NM05_H27]|nr:hypothetical protein E5332_01495 [Enterorhabdus sp. NM05_H27]